jgi:hypothetical protein
MKKVEVTDPEILGMGGDASNDRPDDSTPSPVPELIEEDTADRDLGREAGLGGKSNDTTKSEAWQRGGPSRRNNVIKTLCMSARRNQPRLRRRSCPASASSSDERLGQ